jgi:hypothetical protein
MTDNQKEKIAKKTAVASRFNIYETRSLVAEVDVILNTTDEDLFEQECMRIIELSSRCTGLLSPSALRVQFQIK